MFSCCQMKMWKTGNRFSDKLVGGERENTVMHNRKYLLTAVLTAAVTVISPSAAALAANTSSAGTQVSASAVSQTQKSSSASPDREDGKPAAVSQTQTTAGESSSAGKSRVYKADGEKIDTLEDAGEAYRYFTDESPEPDKKTDGKNSAYQTRRLVVKTDKKELADTSDAKEAVYYEDIGAYVLTYDSAKDAKSAEKDLEKTYGKSFVFPDRVFKSSESGTSESVSSGGYVSWGTETMRLNQTRDNANADPLLKNSVTVAVLDSGINKKHEMFTRRQILSDSRRIIADPFTGATGFAKNYSDDFGHGSHVSGIIADGTSDQVNFLILKILDENGEGSALGLLAALKYVDKYYSNTVKVINISGGITGILKGTNDYRYLESIMKKLYKKGIFVVTAAGNGNEYTEKAESIRNSGTYPADSKYAFAVGAVDRTGSRAYFSNYGKDLDYTAPGVEIKSAWIGGSSSYEVKDGTSMASPHIAAAAAMIRLYHPKYTVTQMQNTLRKYAKDLGAEGYDKYYGYGEVILPKVRQQEITTSEDSYQTSRKKGSSFYLNASAKTKLKYGSKNRSVVKVDQNGKVTVVGKGSTQIVIKAYSSLKYAYARKTVTVTVS